MKANKIISSVVLSAIIAGSIGFKTFANETGNFNAKIVTVANTVSYLTIDAKTLDSGVKSLYLDGKEVKFSKVSDDGKIIKTEFNGKHKSVRIVLENGKVYERQVEGIYNKFPYSAGELQKAPDLVWGHVTIPVWDFHSVVKDENGNEITKPSKTTFRINENAKAIDVIATPTVKISNRIEGLKEGKYHIEKNKDVEFVFDLNNKEEKQKYIRLQSFEFKYKNSSYRIKTKKTKEGKKAIVTLPADGFNTFKTNKEEDLTVRLAGKKPIVLKIYKHEAKKEEKNPNPVEEIDNTVVEYGKNIDLHYNLSNRAEKEKFDRITGIFNVYNDGHEEALNYVKNSKDGTVTIDFASSRPLQSLGTHKVKIAYKGSSPDEKVFNLKGIAPEMMLNSNTGDYEVGKSLLFTLRGFNYTFQQDTGVKAVYLNGEKLVRRYVPNDDEDINELKSKGIDAIENESENGFHVVGNLLRIKNAAKNFVHPGVNYITVKYDNYHDTTFKFVVSEKKGNKSNEKAKVRKRRAVNVISSATSGGVSKPSVGTSDSSGGTVNMGAKVVYDFDMLSNAEIIEDLGYKNPQAKRLIDFFEGTAKEVAVFKNNPNRKVVWDSYMNFVQSNRLNYGKYKSFIEYYNDPSVETTNNASAQYKFVLGNGLGAPIFGVEKLFDVQESIKDVPNDVLNKLDNIDVRSDIVLPLNNWTVKIKSIKINGYKLELNKNYKIDTSNNQLTIKGNLFKNPGTYKLEIETDGFKTLEKSILVKNEKVEDTLVKVNRNPKLQNKLFTGDDLSFVIQDPKAIMTGLYLSVNDEEPVEITTHNGLSYVKSMGQVTIDRKYVLKPGKYMVRMYFQGRNYKDINFDVVGKELTYTKAPISEKTSLRINSNVYSFKFDNFTGNREVLRWMKDIKSIEVNDKKAVKVDKKNVKESIIPENLSYILSYDEDKTFDAGAYIKVVSKDLEKLGTVTEKGQHIRVRIKSNGYADVVFEYNTSGVKPAESREVEIYQVDPSTGEKIVNTYLKSEYLDEEDDTIIADFDEEAMRKEFPGMKLDLQKGYLYNNGELKNDSNFMKNITKIELNGVRLPFGMTGVYVDGNVYGHIAVRFMGRKPTKGDKITIYSKGYKVFHYLVR